jgi:hypothetical protein
MATEEDAPFAATKSQADEMNLKPVFPNPNDGQQVQFYLPAQGDEGELMVRVMDVHGRSIPFTMSDQLTPGWNTLVFGERPSPGMYVIQLAVNQQHYRYPFVIE